MSIKERNDAIIRSVLQQIKNEAETQRILSGEYLEKYNFMKYMTPFGGVRPGNLGDLSDTWFGQASYRDH